MYLETQRRQRHWPGGIYWAECEFYSVYRYSVYRWTERDSAAPRRLGRKVYRFSKTNKGAPRRTTRHAGKGKGHSERSDPRKTSEKPGAARYTMASTPTKSEGKNPDGVYPVYRYSVYRFAKKAGVPRRTTRHARLGPGAPRRGPRRIWKERDSAVLCRFGRKVYRF